MEENMKYVILGLLVLIVVLLIVLIIVLLVRKNRNNDLVEKLGKFETGITKEIGDFKFSFSKVLTGDFEKLNKLDCEVILSLAI